MEDEVVLKQMKKYRTFSIVGIILFIALLFLQYYIIDANTPSCVPYTSITTQEIDAFNSMFYSYEGDKVTGTNVKKLLLRIIANADTYRDEENKVPGIAYENLDDITLMNYKIEKNKEYKDFASKIRNKVKDKEIYKVELEYSDSGMVNLIKITELGDAKVEGNTIVVELEEN